MIPYEILANAIYITEGSAHTHFPYGIKHHYIHTTPRQACINTIKTVERQYKIHSVDRMFIYVLADRYCPVKDDPIGNHNWKVNMVRILNIKK